MSRGEKKNYLELEEAIRANIHIWYKEREEQNQSRWTSEREQNWNEIHKLIHEKENRYLS